MDLIKFGQFFEQSVWRRVDGFDKFVQALGDLTLLVNGKNSTLEHWKLFLDFFLLTFLWHVDERHAAIQERQLEIVCQNDNHHFHDQIMIWRFQLWNWDHLAEPLL